MLVGISDGEKVAFSVHLRGDKAVSLTGGSVVLFDQVLTNIGNGYNENSGAFTAPVAGTYFFTIYFMAGGTGKYAHLGIFVNGESKCTQYAEGPYGVGTCSIIEELSVGDVVNVKIFYPATSNLYGSSSSYKHQHGFVGLLYKKK